MNIVDRIGETNVNRVEPETEFRFLYFIYLNCWAGGDAMRKNRDIIGYFIRIIKG